MIFRVTACKEVRLVKMSYVCTLELAESEYKHLHIQHAESWVVSFPEPLVVGEEIDLSPEGMMAVAVQNGKARRESRWGQQNAARKPEEPGGN